VISTVRAYTGLALWAALIALSAWWNLSEHKSDSNESILGRARVYFSIVQTHRLWNSEHGGVYVPVTPRTPPNPYLTGPLRDLRTVEGIELTKVNPAYMTRQVSALALEKGSVFFHITSLKPLRPGNRPDEWEAGALTEFEAGTSEKFELVRVEDGLFYRYMAPLYTKESCLLCHAEQGYAIGDVRGGISVSFGAEPLLAVYNHEQFRIVTIHTTLFLMVAFAMGWILYHSHRSEAALEKNRERYRALVELTDAVHWEMDTRTLRFTYISPQAGELLGYPPKKWTDFYFWADLLHPEDRQWATEHSKSHMARGEGRIFTYRMLRADGRVLWIKDMANVVTDSDGAPVALRGILLDVTELKQT
jgi:PAS domain S-box-containing protein